MHEAYEATVILKKLPLQIESIASFEDFLILGTRQGHLLVYRIPNKKTKSEVDLLRSNKSFAKRPITQINVVPEVGILLVLSDNGISVHELRDLRFPLIEPLVRTKGANLFAVDVQKQQSLTGEVQYFVRLCVSIKRKLQMYYWKNKERAFLELTSDLGVSDIPRALSWCGESVCIGFRLEYSLIKVASGELKDLFPTGKQLDPVVCRLNENNLALGKDEQTIFIDSEGTPTLKYAVPWTEIPIALEYDQPYLLAVLPSSVEVRTTEPRLLIQNIGLPKVRFISHCKSGCIFVASSTDVWCLYAVDIQQQISKLLHEKLFELALHLTNIIDNSDTEKQKLVQRIQNMHAFDLFCKKNFKEAMDIFLKLGTDPSQVIGLFPDLLPEAYQNSLVYPDHFPALQGEDLENGLTSLIDYLMNVRNTSMKNLNDNINLTAIVEGQKTIQKKNQLFKIIDTTLLKCYLQVNDALVASLLRLSDNFCHVEESERALKRHQRYSELIILYQYKGLHKKALELLKKQSEKPEPQLRGHSRTVQYLQHLGKEYLDLILEFSKWVLEKHPEDGLKIFTEDLPETEGLPRHRVLEHLKEHAPKLVIPYLEHIILNWKEETDYFHNILVKKYCTTIQQLLPCVNNSLTEADTDELVKMSAELREYRVKLMSFLENPKSKYSAETFPALLISNRLYEEAAIVMAKLERHEDVLAIYIHYLFDPQKAENYCVKVYSNDSTGKKEVFVLLLKAFLNPSSLRLNFSLPMPKAQSSENPDIMSALRILREHASKIEAEKALDLLPDTVRVSELRNFLELVLQERYVCQHNTQVTKSLYLGEHLQTYSQKIQSEACKITLTDLDVCWICQKRIGKSAFARFPNEIIVHYSCKDKYNSKDF